MSPDQSFADADFSRSDTDLSLALSPTIQTRTLRSFESKPSLTQHALTCAASSSRHCSEFPVSGTYTFSVSFVTAAAFVHELVEARDERRLLRLQKQMAICRLLFIDELGFVPPTKTGAELFSS